MKIGWGTGIALTLLRTVLLIGFLNSSARDWSLFVQLAFQLLLSAAFTAGAYRRQVWAAIGLLVIWGIGYLYSWAVSGRLIPPLALIGILVWYGLYRGLRGTRKLAAIQNRFGGRWLMIAEPDERLSIARCTRILVDSPATELGLGCTHVPYARRADRHRATRSPSAMRVLPISHFDRSGQIRAESMVGLHSNLVPTLRMG